MTDVPSCDDHRVDGELADLGDLLDQGGHPQERRLEGQPSRRRRAGGQPGAGDQPGGVEVGEREHPHVGGRSSAGGRAAGPERDDRADGWVVAAPEPHVDAAGRPSAARAPA